ncbi:MAG TPA: ABC transporter substrate-binding protein [Acidimicrobiales bacterium]|jgi:ABC-type branched-subunit amino acid transport system substrate-binding protein
MRTNRPLFRILALLFAFVLIGAACGRDDEDSADAPAATDDGDDGGDDTSDTTAAEGTDEDDSGGELATAPGFDGSTIKVGIVTPQTGGVEVIGNPLTTGNQVYFDYVNDELGGIAGQYQIETVVVDSQYDATVGLQQYNAIKDDVVMFAQILGTPVVNTVLEQLRQDNIVAAPASLDSFWVREQNLLPIGGPYQVQAINAMDWWINEGGGSTDATVCTMIQDDPYGEAGQEGVEFAAEQLGFEVAATARFGATDTDFTAQVGQLSEANCEVVFLVSTPTGTGGILGVAAAQNFTPQWIGQSPTWIGLLAASPLAEYLQANFKVVAEGTEWGDESVPGMADMIARQEQYAPDQGPDYYFAFGYNQAQAVVQVLEAAVENGDLSREGIIEAMNSLDTLTFDGLSGDYEWGAPEDRNPPRASTIFEVDPEKPFGLGVVARDYESEAADAFEFEG